MGPSDKNLANLNTAMIELTQAEKPKSGSSLYRPAVEGEKVWCFTGGKWAKLKVVSFADGNYLLSDGNTYPKACVVSVTDSKQHRFSFSSKAKRSVLKEAGFGPMRGKRDRKVGFYASLERVKVDPNPWSWEIAASRSAYNCVRVLPPHAWQKIQRETMCSNLCSDITPTDPVKQDDAHRRAIMLKEELDSDSDSEAKSGKT